MEKKGGGGLSKLSVEKLLSHITETFRRGNLLCCVSENFEKFYGGLNEKFLSHSTESFLEIFCLKMPKNFFSLSRIWGKN